MKLGRFAARTIIGGLFIGHGTQKLFGWFGGGGMESTAAGFESIGLRPGRRNAAAAGLAEAVGARRARGWSGGFGDGGGARAASARDSRRGSGRAARRRRIRAPESGAGAIAS
jgi:hypothetical protein